MLDDDELDDDDDDDESESESESDELDESDDEVSEEDNESEEVDEEELDDDRDRLRSFFTSICLVDSLSLRRSSRLSLDERLARDAE